MKLSNKVKALLQLLALIAAGILGSEVIQYITAYVSRETIITGVQIGCISGLLYLCYSLLLARIDYQDTLDNLNETTKEKV